MKFAFLSDVHVRDDRLDGAYGQGRLLDDCAAAIIDAAPSFVLVGGDLTGTTVPHKATPRERNAIVMFLMKFARAGIPVLTIRGNHDYPGDWDFLRHFSNVRWSTCPEVVTMRSGVKVATLPWQDDKEPGSALETLRKSWDLDKVVVLVAHAAVEGAMTGTGQPAIYTEDPILLRAALAGTAPLFVCLGHYHDFQEWKSRRMFYVGSLFVNEYGERVPKGWALCDVENGTYEHRELVQPLRHKVVYDAAIDKIVETSPELMSGLPCHIKVVARYDEKDSAVAAANVAGLRQRLTNEMPIFSFLVEAQVTRAARTRAGALEVMRAETLGEKLDRYVEASTAPVADVVRQRAHAILAEMQRDYLHVA